MREDKVLLNLISLEHTPINFTLVGYYLTAKVKRNVAQKGGFSRADGNEVWGAGSIIRFAVALRTTSRA